MSGLIILSETKIEYGSTQKLVTAEIWHFCNEMGKEWAS